MEGPNVLLETRSYRIVQKSRIDSAGKEHCRAIICHPGAVVMLPMLDDGRIVLIGNHRIAVGERLIELPAGTLDPGEEPLQTAHRELAEETGYRARSMEHVTTFYTSPGIMDERMHLFLATGLNPGSTALAEGEDILPVLVTWDEAMAMVRDGRIQDAKTLVGLLHYATFRRHA